MSIKFRNIYYGWFVVAAGFAVMAIIGETLPAFGVYFIPLENDFGWSRSLISSGYTAFTIGYGTSVIVAGRLVDRHRPQPILLAAGIVASLGLFLSSQMVNIDQLRISFFLVGLGAGGCFSVPTTTVQRWFFNRRRSGVALGLVMTGVGVGGLVFAPLLNYLILSHGWRYTFQITAGIFIATTLIGMLVIKRPPVAVSSVINKNEATDKSKASTQSLSTRKALKTPALAGIAFAAVASLLVYHSLSVHLVPFTVDMGISRTVAAAALGLLSGFSVPGRLSCGFISQRMGWQKSLGFACFGMAAPLVALLFIKDVWVVYGFVLVFGISYGARTVAQIGMISQCFGLRSIGETTGIIVAISNLGSAVSPYITGFIFDSTGSYYIAFAILAIVMASAGFVALLIKNPQGKASVTPGK